MKTEMYSWRLSAEVRADLEREARTRKEPVSAILDEAVHEWLKKSREALKGEEEQQRLHTAAEQCLGSLAGRDTRRAEMARKKIRARLGRRYGR